MYTISPHFTVFNVFKHNKFFILVSIFFFLLYFLMILVLLIFKMYQVDKYGFELL